MGKRIYSNNNYHLTGRNTLLLHPSSYGSSSSLPEPIGLTEEYLRNIDNLSKEEGNNDNNNNNLFVPDLPLESTKNNDNGILVNNNGDTEEEENTTLSEIQKRGDNNQNSTTTMTMATTTAATIPSSLSSLSTSDNDPVAWNNSTNSLLEKTITLHFEEDATATAPTAYATTVVGENIVHHQDRMQQPSTSSSSSAATTTTTTSLDIRNEYGETTTKKNANYYNDDEKAIVDKKAIVGENSNNYNNMGLKPLETKFYSLWQRRPRPAGRSMEGGLDDDVDGSLSESSSSGSKGIIPSSFSLRDGISEQQLLLQPRESSSRKWNEWMISGRRIRDDPNEEIESSSSLSSSSSPSYESSSSLSNDSSYISNNIGGKSEMMVTTLDIPQPMTPTTIATMGGSDENKNSFHSVPSKRQSMEDEITPAGMMTTITTDNIFPQLHASTANIKDTNTPDDRKVLPMMWWARRGMNRPPSQLSSSINIGKSFRELIQKGEVMKNTKTIFTTGRWKKMKYPKESEGKGTTTAKLSPSSEQQPRRKQSREPGRVSACDWRQNILNLPSSTILRDVRNPVIWVFLWATLWSIVYECLRRLAEASSSMAFLLSNAGEDGKAVRTSATTILGPTTTTARWLSAAAWSAKHMCLPTVQHTMMVSAVSLLLVFRTNSAYQRFAEGRKIWNDIVDTARDFSRMIKLYEFAIGASKCRRVNSLLASFPYLLRHRIRPSLMTTFYRVNDSNVERDPEHSLLLYPDESLRDTDPELIALAKDEEETGFIKRKTRELCWVDRRTLPWKLIPGSALELCARAQNRPLWVCDRMAKELAVVEDSTTKFTNRERMALLGYVDKLSRSIGACERIHQTVVPMNYARHALRSLTVWLWTLPFVLVKDLGLLTGPVVAILSWILFGVYEIGSRIEDPFQGTLRLSVYCDAIRRDVLADAIARDTAFILEEEGKSSIEKERGYDAIFELDSESEEYDGDDIPPTKRKQKMWPFSGDMRL